MLRRPHGPADVTENSGLDIGPHPHIGLQTVTWLTDGQVLHRDSLGSEQVIKPGQLNLMTAGNAVSHAEEATGHYRGTLEGIQMWVALPEHTRHGPAFEHHAELPQADLDSTAGSATVLIGDFGSLTSPARHDTPLVGVELDLRAPATVPLRPDWEYALVVLQGAVAVHGRPCTRPARLPRRRTRRAPLDVREPTRVMLLGGEPFPNPSLCGGTSSAAPARRSTPRTPPGPARTTVSAAWRPPCPSSRPRPPSGSRPPGSR
ncbi:pirin family protein [Streptomyces sp. INA 01156]